MPYYTNTKIDGVNTMDAADLEAIETGFASVEADLVDLSGITDAPTALTNLGLTSLAAEINITDGSTAATATTLADADRVVVNDSGTMVQVALTDFSPYFSSLPNLVTVGALDSGSITSGFGAIDVGASNITTTGNIAGGAITQAGVSVATLGANTFTANQTIEGDLFVKGTVPFVLLEETGVSVDNGKWALLANGERLSLRAYADSLGTSQEAIVLTRTGLTIDSINLQSSSNQSNGVEIATLGANTFTANQIIKSASAASLLTIDAITGQSSGMFIRENGLAAMVFFNDAAQSKVFLQKYAANGTDVASQILLEEDGDINVVLGQLQQGSVNVATVNTNWATTDITSGVFADARVQASNVTQHVASIDHDSLLNFVTAEHLNWSADLGATNIHVNNVTASAVTQHVAAIDHNALLNFAANEHLDWTADLGATNIHVNNVTAAAVTQHVASIDHDALLNFAAAEHLIWSNDLGATNLHVNNITEAGVTQHKAAVLASAALTGTPTSPTAAAGTSTTQVASTAFVQGEKAFRGFSASPSAADSAANGTLLVNTTNFNLLAEDFDTDSWFTPSTGKFQPNVAGYYACEFNFSASSISAGLFIHIKKNSVDYAQSWDGNVGPPDRCLSVPIHLNGSTDFVEFQVTTSDVSWFLEAETRISAYLIGT